MTKYEIIAKLQELLQEYQTKDYLLKLELDEQVKKEKIILDNKDKVNQDFLKYTHDLEIYEKTVKICRKVHSDLSIKYRKIFIFCALLSLLLMLISVYFHFPEIFLIIISTTPIIGAIINFKIEYSEKISEVTRVKKEYKSYKDIKKKRLNAKKNINLLKSSHKLNKEKQKEIKSNHFTCELAQNIISEILVYIENLNISTQLIMPEIDTNSINGVMVLRRMRYNLRKDDLDGKNI